MIPLRRRDLYPSYRAIAEEVHGVEQRRLPSSVGPEQDVDRTHFDVHVG